MILGICGRKGSGKSTLAKMLCCLVPGARSIAFADPLKQFVSELYDWPMAQLEDQTFKETPDLRYPRGGTSGSIVHLTPRHAMQQLGTEWGRACYEQTWVRYGLRRAQALEADGCPLVLITDVRFINEGEAIAAVGGAVVRIERAHMDATDPHGSEREVGRVPTRYTIYNHGGLRHLQAYAASLVQMLDLPPIEWEEMPADVLETLEDIRVAELEAENGALKDKIKALAAVLRQVELSTGDPDTAGCPICGTDSVEGHSESCELRVALNLVEGGCDAHHRP